MLTISSQQFTHSSKAELLLNKISPTYRNKRIPSAQDNYSCSSNKNLKISKTESPSKFSEQIRRRKSQYLEGSSHCKEKPSSNQNIINSINYLKEQYKSLKEAYKELIEEKVKNTEEIKLIKQKNCHLKSESQKIGKENQKLKINNSLLEQEQERMKKQYFRLLEIQKLKTKKLEEFLTEKCTIYLIQKYLFSHFSTTKN